MISLPIMITADGTISLYISYMLMDRIIGPEKEFWLVPLSSNFGPWRAMTGSCHFLSIKP
jgi:hypothetical protein